MKKLLGILVLALFLTNNAYSNTPTEKFVFEKLFDEYSHCTVYYKFLSRGVEKKGELNNKEKLFIDEMNQLSEESEKNMFFFSKKLNVSSKNVQKNIEKIYKSFLDIAGYDYSKTEILNNKYLEICENSLTDPKARMIYWNQEYAKSKVKKTKKKDDDLTGTKLLCLSNLKEDEKIGILAYHFINSKEVYEYRYSQNDYDLILNIKDYKALPSEINITDRDDYSKLAFTRSKIFISRKNLNLKFYNNSFKAWWDWWDCKIKDQNFDISNHLKSIKEKEMKERLL